MECCPAEGSRINQFALVSYIPEQLGAFLDRLRRELVCDCVARSHVTVLPPRELCVPSSQAAEQLGAMLEQFPSFPIDLTNVEVFPGTNVIYLAIGSGRDQIIDMHRSLNYCDLKYNEKFSFHPHVTLAHNHPIEVHDELLELTRRRWQEWQGPRTYEVDILTFVQNTEENLWVDLADYNLPEPVLATSH